MTRRNPAHPAKEHNHMQNEQDQLMGSPRFDPITPEDAHYLLAVGDHDHGNGNGPEPSVHTLLDTGAGMLGAQHKTLAETRVEIDRHGITWATRSPTGYSLAIRRPHNETLFIATKAPVPS